MMTAPSVRPWARVLPGVFLLLVLVLLGSGCAIWDTRNTHAVRTSLIDYLGKPDSAEPMKPTVPHLQLPLRVGLAWTPGEPRAEMDPVSAAFQEQVLQDVRRQFTNLSFVSEVVVIPSFYLRPGGGFENLDQIHRTLGIDVIALVSRDQVRFTDPTRLSFFYITVVGAYTVPGQLNETHTMVDTAVFDIPSRSLLFRAAGVHSSSGHSTLVTSDTDARKELNESLRLASNGMSTNLTTELKNFQERIRQKPESVRVTHRPGYTGAGATGWSDIGWITLLTLGCFAALRLPER